MRAETFIFANLIAILCLSTVAHLAFGIANAYVASQTTSAKKECGEAIWYCVMVLAILNFLAFANGIMVTIKLLISSSDEKNSNNLLGYAVLGVSIWACIAYFEISEDCRDFYVSNFPMLFDMLKADVIYFFCSLGLVGWACFSTCFAICCCGKSDSDRRDSRQPGMDV